MGRRGRVSVHRLGFLGIRTDRFDETVRLFEDALGLPVIRREPGRLVWFRLGDGTELHVYGPDDDEHAFFDSGPVVGLVVPDADEARASMESAGIEFIGEMQRADGASWNHFRGPDGNVYEVMSRRDEGEAGRPSRPS